MVRSTRSQALGLFMLLASAAAPALAQPANDLCTSPQAIPTASFPQMIFGNNLDASSDIVSTCATIDDDDIDVWYSLTAAQAGLYTFDCIGSIDFLDPTLSLWTDCTTRVACDDNGGGGFNARVSRTLSVGQTILVRVGAMSFFGDFGDFQLNVTFTPSGPVNNDTCANAITITSLPFSDTNDYSTATDDLDVGCNDPAATVTKNGRWYTYTPGANGVVRFENSSAIANVIIAVFTGTCAAPVSFVCQGGIGIAGVAYGVTVPVTAGTTYRILVGSYTTTGFGAGTSLNFTATAVTPEPNDLCANATAVTTLPLTDEIVFPNASFDRDVTCNSTTRNNSVTHNGVWYTFTAPSTAQIQFVFDPGVSTGSAALGVFTGTCAAPTQVACFDTFPATFTPVAGTAYRFLVGAGSSLGATFTRNLTITTPNPPPANDTCAGATAVMVGVAANGDNTNATSTNDGPTPSCQTQFVKSVWHTVTPAATGSYRITTCGSGHDTVLSVFSGSCASPTQVGCDDDGCGGLADADLTSDIPTIDLTGGQTYLIRVSAFNAAPGPTGGLYTLLVSANASSGACCRGATCSIDTSTNCTGFAAGFAGANTVCNTLGVNNLSPCCLADFNHIGGITVQDIFDFLADYFSGNARADINGGGVTVQDIFDYLAVYFVAGC